MNEDTAIDLTQSTAPPTEVYEVPAAAEWRHINSLVPWVKNPKHNDHKIQEAAGKIRRFGWGAPVIAWRDAAERWYPDSRHQVAGDRIAAGHLRRKAILHILSEDPGYVLPGAPAPGFVPVRFMHFPNEGEYEAFAIQDNVQMGEWDDAELAEIVARNVADGVDMTGLGWSDEEVAKMVEETGIEPEEELAEEELDETDGAAAPPEAKAAVVFNVGGYRFQVARDEYETWFEELRLKVGFEKEAVIGEVKRRLGLTASSPEGE